MYLLRVRQRGLGFGLGGRISLLKASAIAQRSLGAAGVSDRSDRLYNVVSGLDREGWWAAFSVLRIPGFLRFEMT